MSGARRRALTYGLAACIGSVLGCGGDEPPVPLELAAQGPYQSMQRVVMIDPPEGDADSIQGNLWLPTSPTEDPPAQGFPLVAFLPASTTTGVESYQSLLGHIASHGYAVLAVNLRNQGDDPTRQINRLWHAVAVTLEQGAAVLDAERIVLSGHSIGGKIALLASSLNHPLRDNVATVIAWDPIDFVNPRDAFAVSVTPEHMPNVQVPALIFGTPISDCVLEGDSHQEFFDEAKPGSLQLFFPNADHVDWADDFGEGVYGFFLASNLCNRVGPDSGIVVHRVTRRSQVAWLKRHLDGEPDMERYLTGAEADEVRAGKVVASEK